MIITLQNTCFCVSGSFTSFSYTALAEDALKKKGARITATVTKDTQVFVRGLGNLRVFNAQFKAATGRKIPVIDERQLRELLESGAIEVEDLHPARPLDELLGEARSALEDPPTEARWERLTGLVDACKEEEREALIQYIHDHTEQWSERERLQCVAPVPWLIAMSQGTDSPAYRLVRRLDLERLDFKTNEFKRIVKCQSLVNVSHLNIAVGHRLTKTAFSTLGKQAHFKNVTHLAVGYLEAEWASTIQGAFKALRSVELCWQNYGDSFHREGVEALLTSHMCAQVTTLTISSRSDWGSSSISCVLALLKHPDALPCFSHLRLDLFCFGQADHGAAVRDTTISWLTDPGRHGVSKEANARVEKLTLITQLLWRSASRQPGTLDFSHLPNLKTLCLQGFAYTSSRYTPSTPEELQRHLELLFHMCEMKFPDSLTQIRTTAPLDRAPFAEFITARPDLDIVHDAPLIPILD